MTVTLSSPEGMLPNAPYHHVAWGGPGVVTCTSPDRWHTPMTVRRSRLTSPGRSRRQCGTSPADYVAGGVRISAT